MIPRRRSLNFFSKKSGFDRQNVDAESIARFYFPILPVRNFGEKRVNFVERFREIGFLEIKKRKEKVTKHFN